MQVGDENDKEAQAKAMREIITQTLKESVPDATEEEIDKISLEHMTKLMESIMEVNQLEGTSEGKTDFLEKVKAKQNVKSTGNTGNKKPNE